MKKYKSILLCICLLFALGACSDYLDQVPEEKLSEANLFKSKDDVVKVLTQIYSFYKSPIDFKGNLGIMGDDADFIWTDQAIYKKDIGAYSQSAPIFNNWDKFYEQIRTSLYFIDRIDECKDQKLSEQERAWWKGEAYFLQAYYYFLLYQQYGPVPLIDKVYDGNSLIAVMNEGIPRANADTLVNYIDKLLVKSIDLLDLSYIQTIPDRAGRANKCSARFLRSRLWLFAASPLNNGMKSPKGEDYSFLMPKDNEGKELISKQFDANKWKKAMEFTRQAIETANAATLGLYMGDNTYNNGFSAYKRVFSYSRGGEPIMENIFYKQNIETTEFRQHSLPISWSGFSGICPTLEHVNEYFMANGLMPEDDADYKNASGFETYEKDGLHVKQYKKYMKRDPRFYANILYPERYSYAMLSSTQESYSTKWASDPKNESMWFRPYYDGPDGYASKTGRDYSSTGFLCTKWTETTASKTGKGDNAVPIFRFAELLLNYSEAAIEYYAAIGENPSTHPDVFEFWDQLRSRIKIPGVKEAYDNAGIALTTEKLRELIHRERRVELAFEGHRYFDNRRWLDAEREGGAKHGMDVFKTDNGGFWNENYVFETRVWNNKMYFMPIPQPEMDKNPKLTQNPLW